VGHLIGVEHDLQGAMSGDKAVGAASHVESTQAAADRQAGRRPAQTLSEWHRAVGRTLTQVAAGDPGVIVGLHGMQLPLYALLVGRAFELWTHENDIRVSTRLHATAPDAPTLALMTRLAATLLPHAAVGSGLCQSARLHLVLTGPGGGTWDVTIGQGAGGQGAGGQEASGQVREVGQEGVAIVADAVGFCLLAGNRVTPAELGPHIIGDESRAVSVLAATPALALD
jgi:hypothetical protein